MAISITPSPFGSVTVTLDGELGGVLSVDVLATSNSALNMDLGVPGPTGATGATGAAGTNGTNGVGVPVGGTAGQVLAKINSTNYNTEWVDAGAAGDFLPLAGGTMSGDITFSVDNNGNDSLVGAFGFGVENTNGQVAYIQPDVFRIYDNDHLTGTSVNGAGITFNDSTVQTTAGLPLTGGTMSGTINSIGYDSQYSFNADLFDTSPLEGSRFAQALIGSDGTYGFIKLQGEFTTSVGLYGNSEGAFIKFGDGTTQTTAFPGYNGTTLQYIDGTGDYITFPTIPSIAGLLVNSNNLSDLNNTTTARTNLGLGSMAVETATDYLTKAGNLSGLASTSTARTNLGLGTMATATATDYLAKADNLLGLASTSTARTNLGLGTAATQSTATFLQTANNLSDLTASTARTNLGLGAVSTDAYATTAQAQAGTSTTTVISPSTLFDTRWFAGSKSMVQIAWSTAVSGTGASANAQNSNARLNIAPTTATGYAIASAIIANNSRGTTYNAGFDFSKRIAIGLRVARNVASPDSASVWRFSIGKNSATDASDISARGLQVKVAGSGALQLLVHNGTTLTTTTSSYTPANGVSYDIVVTSDGAGACVLYVNGTSVATSSGGPTTAGATTAGFMMFEVQNTSVITGSPQNICISDYFVQVNS